MVETEDAPKKIKKKPGPRPCLCGCGSQTSGGWFVIGHDSKMKKMIRDGVKLNKEQTDYAEKKWDVAKLKADGAATRERIKKAEEAKKAAAKEAENKAKEAAKAAAKGGKKAAAPAQAVA